MERVLGCELRKDGARMKLLLPIDGSLASINAAKKAFKLAKKDGYTIKMISVINQDDIHNYLSNEKAVKHLDGFWTDKHVFPEYNEELFTILRNKSIELMDSILAKADVEGVPIEKEVLRGEPYKEIIKTAKIGAFDLIVIGNRGFSKIKRFFLGSVTNRVISEAPCPVLVIPAEAEE